MARRSARASSDQITAIRSGAGGSVFTQAELAQAVFVRNAFSTSQRSAGTIECRRCFRRDLFPFHGRGSQCTRQRAGHCLKQVNNGGELASIELIEELVCLLFFIRGCHQNSLLVYQCARLRDCQLPLEATSKLIARMTAR